MKAPYKLAIALGFAALVQLRLIGGASAAEDSSAATPPPPDADSEAAHKHLHLKEELVLTVETNVPPLLAATNTAQPPEKTFDWKLRWEGWNGLNIEVKKKTLLGKYAPGTTNVEDALNMRWLLFSESLPTNALRLDLEEVKMTTSLGARFDVDAAHYFPGNGFEGFNDGVELRRARLTAKGDAIFVLPFSYQLEIGYVPHTFTLQDSFVVFKTASFLGDLKIGQFQPPMGLEPITGSRFDPYMEQAAPMQALAPGSDAGAQIGHAVLGDRMSWQFGFFGEGVGQDVGDASQDFARAIMRVTGLPIYDFNPEHPDDTRLLHLGLSANVLYSGDSTVRYQSRPESFQAPYVVDTGDIHSEGALVVGGEVAWVNGPFSVQAEYLHSFVKESPSTNGAPTLGFDGFYASASVFLTGESRPYDRQKGSFSRVIPRHNFNLRQGGGLGALELAARVSYVDLKSDNIQGGKLAMLMTSVNWYLQPHIVLRFEYGFGHVSDYNPSGNINLFQTRLQLDF